MNKKLLYEIIYQTECGPEELFVLVGTIAETYGLNDLLNALVYLVNEGFMTYNLGDKKELDSISLQDLELYVNSRLKLGEQLDEPPSSCVEYSFVATEKGRESFKSIE